MLRLGRPQPSVVSKQIKGRNIADRASGAPELRAALCNRPRVLCHGSNYAGKGSIGTGDTFSKGPDFAAWLGLMPKQISTGDHTILGPISRRGNRYLRALFVQAAWSCSSG
jgi:Transposase IS116/IS110/IS902 family